MVKCTMQPRPESLSLFQTHKDMLPDSPFHKIKAARFGVFSDSDKIFSGWNKITVYARLGDSSDFQQATQVFRSPNEGHSYAPYMVIVLVVRTKYSFRGRTCQFQLRSFFPAVDEATKWQRCWVHGLEASLPR